VHMGQYDSWYNPDVTAIVNFPSYIAHLDTNLRMTWIHSFTYDTAIGHRQKTTLKVLQDTSYLVVGDCWLPPPYGSYFIGWASKVDKNGNEVWSRTYRTSANENSYLRDAAERNDGRIVMVGGGFNDTLPSWHNWQDVWLVGIDANGCELAGCGVDTASQVPAVAVATDDVVVWPNPTTGQLFVRVAHSGRFVLYDMIGRQLSECNVITGQAELKIPPGTASGMYMGVFKPADGGLEKEVRIIYQP
jgi:hypothetical protein